MNKKTVFPGEMEWSISLLAIKYFFFSLERTFFVVVCHSYKCQFSHVEGCPAPNAVKLLLSGQQE